jgi:hypothetical protein
VSPEQCSEARGILKWTPRQLADAADVPLWFITAFEDGRETAAFLAGFKTAIRETLEAVGIGFPFEITNGRLWPLPVTYSRKIDGKAE